MAAGPNHVVDARPAAKHSSHIEGHSPSVEPRVWLGSKIPLPLGLKIQGPLASIHDAWYVIATTSFQEQHLDGGIFRETTRHHRSGRPRAANNKIVARLQLSSQLLLIEPDALREIDSFGAQCES